MSGTLKVGGKTLATHDTNTNVAKIQLGSTSDVVLTDSAGNTVMSESGGVVTLNNATLGSSVLGLPSTTFAYGVGGNAYDGSKVKYNVTRVSSGITFGPSDNTDATNFVPPSTGYYHISVNVNFFNESPAAPENDSGTFILNWQDSGIETLYWQFYVPSSPTTSHEGKGISMSTIYQVTAVGGASDYFNLTYTQFNMANFNENYRITIFKLS